MIDFESVITLDGVPLEVTAEIYEHECEPYSWGGSRGTEKVVYILSVELGGHNIMELLADSVLKRLEEKIIESL